MKLNEKIFLLILLIVIIIAASYYIYGRDVPKRKKKRKIESFAAEEGYDNMVDESMINDILNDDNDVSTEKEVFDYKNKKFYRNVNGSEDTKKLFKAKDYLPKEKHKDWFEVPSTTVTLDDANLIDNKDFIGVNTVGSSLRNASLDLRPAPPCPRITVSPWNQSTIDPDTNIRPL